MQHLLLPHARCAVGAGRDESSAVLSKGDAEDTFGTLDAVGRRLLDAGERRLAGARAVDVELPHAEGRVVRGRGEGEVVPRGGVGRREGERGDAVEVGEVGDNALACGSSMSASMHAAGSAAHGNDVPVRRSKTRM